MAAAALAAWLSLRHPLWPTAMPAAWALCAMWLFWLPGHWLWLLPAALPLANLSPWTGWLAVEEFDLAVLAVLSALHARRWWDGPAARPPPRWSTAETALASALWAVTGLGLALGVHGAGCWQAFSDWFGAHEDPVWALRGSKSWVAALLLWPWMRSALAESARRSMHAVARGMLLGLAAVCAVSVAERLAYPGLQDFASHYRTTAMFWEMHVGGAAIDAYLAMTTPFAAWALWRAHEEHHAGRWLVSGLLAVLVTYVCLTTFARGVYLAAGASLGVLALAGYAQLASQGRTSRRLRWLALGIGAAAVIGAAAGMLAAALHAWGAAGLLACALLLLGTLAWAVRWHSRHHGWRLPAALALATVLLLEVMVVLGGESFMAKRIDDGPVDLDNRVNHWRHGLGLLRAPHEWLFGLGAGRFPARYAASSPQRDFSGRLSWSADAPGTAQAGPASGVAQLEGPRQRPDLGGLYAATQRVELTPGGPYIVRLTARTAAPARLLLRVCERHLLYDGDCQAAVVRLAPGPSWTTVEARLRGPSLGEPGDWWAPTRGGVFSASVLAGSGPVEIDRIRLTGPLGNEVLKNGDFSDGLARWFPSAQRYYLPWHSDNLLLELLTERGLLGTIAFAALVFTAMGTLLRALPVEAAGGDNLAPVFIASLAGMLCVGLVSSVLDVPRLGFLALFLALLSVSRRPQTEASIPAGQE